MKSKVIAGIVAALFGVSMLCLQFTPVFGIALMFFIVVANYEILNTAQVKNKGILALSCVVAGIIPPIVEYNLLDYIPLPKWFFILVYIFILLVLMLRKYSETRFEHVAMALMSSVVVPFAISTIMLIRNMYKVTAFDPYTKSNCTYLVLFALICAWMTDTMAYFSGSKFGKHKMSPNISPKKSWEGAIGGVVGTAVINVIIWLVYFALGKFEVITPLFIPLWIIPIASVILSVIAMIGDLSASAIKRNYGIKDFGTIMGKGQGGVMDRFDSAVLVVPAVYMFILIYEAVR